MNYNKYTKPQRGLDKKKIIMIIIVIAIIVGAGIGLFIRFSSYDKKVEEETVVQEIDTSITGDASIDPENEEIKEETGESVDSNDLKEEQGKSNGIDVSKWQGKINWSKVKNSHIDFAFIRIGYRGEDGKIYKDDNADYNIQQAIKNDVLVGVYFFSTAVNENEAKEEANWTMKAIEGYSISYPVVYDCEGFTSNRMASLTVDERTNNAMTFLKTVKSGGYEVMFYTSLSDAHSHWNMSKIEAEYKIWIAQYSTTIYPKKAKPDYNGECAAWQYTNKGSVSGVNGNVDMVVCYFTKDKAKPKNENATVKTAVAPLTEEEKMYTTVNEKVTAKDVTNLRKSATTKSDVVVQLKNGETVTRIGVGTNGWSKLKYNNQTVYAITSYLTTDLTIKEEEQEVKEDIVAGHTFTAKNDKVTAKDIVNLRSLPTTDSDKVGTLKSGDFLTRTAVSNKGWSRLTYNGQDVYAVTSYLSNEVVKQEEPEQTITVSDGFSAVDEQVTAKDETNLRTAPSTTDSEIVYKLKNGEYVRRIGVHNNGWSKLEYNGQTVYAISSYLTK